MQVSDRMRIPGMNQDHGELKHKCHCSSLNLSTRIPADTTMPLLTFSWIRHGQRDAVAVLEDRCMQHPFPLLPFF